MEDTITTYLAENKAHVVYSTTDASKGKLSHTAYRVLKDTKEFSLLEVNLLTGRKHQIRVHLAGIGHPVVGDEKYGKGKETYKRLALHAKSISFIHPFSGKRLTFETGFPEYFNRLVGSKGQDVCNNLFFDTPKSLIKKQHYVWSLCRPYLMYDRGLDIGVLMRDCRIRIFNGIPGINTLS